MPRTPKKTKIDDKTKRRLIQLPDFIDISQQTSYPRLINPSPRILLY
ncbi:MAG: hypothetical protein MPK06_03015 [Alphaproteobacteria bacterium]|nr:hypothetical protein [Alphaproteobacteria bacterium]